MTSLVKLRTAYCKQKYSVNVLFSHTWALSQTSFVISQHPLLWMMSPQGVEPQRGWVSAWVMSWSVFSEVDHISHALAWIFYAVVCGQTCASPIWSAVFVVGVCTCDGVCCCVKSYAGDWPCCNHDRELLNQSGSVTGLFITSGFTDAAVLRSIGCQGCVPFRIEKLFIHFQMLNLNRKQNCNSNLNSST